MANVYETINHPSGHVERRLIDDTPPPTPEPILNITNVVFSGAGYDDTVDGVVELLTDKPVNLSFDIPLDNGTKLKIPIKQRGGSGFKLVKAVVNSGSISIVVKFKDSGDWYINSQLVNERGRVGVDFAMDDINIEVLDD